MDEVTTTRDGVDPPPGGEPSRRPRRWGVLTTAVVVVVAFVAVVALSTRSSSVPVGASGSMPGMAMGGMSTAPGGDRLAVTMRDLDDRTVRLPGGRPDVVVFAEARGCDACVAAARAAVRRTGARAQLIVVMADSATGREDVAVFARAVGRSAAHYVIDDRGGSLATMLGAPGLGRAVVYDARGRILARSDGRARQLVAALRRA